MVFATETLAAGINMPARSTAICALSRRRDRGISMLTHNELLQMAGRAGRRGFDTQGMRPDCSKPYIVAVFPYECSIPRASVLGADPHVLWRPFCGSLRAGPHLSKHCMVNNWPTCSS